MFGEQRHAHSQNARLTAVNPSDPGYGGLAVGEHPPSVPEQLRSGVGELDVLPCAGKELDAECSLESRDCLRKRRLADEHARRRPSEVQLLGDGDEVLELAELQLGFGEPRIAYVKQLAARIIP